MKFKLSTIILLLISINSFGQIHFEKGYIIDNDNQLIDCFIKNYDWNNNPTEIEYKINDNEETKRANLTNTKEFGITGIARYIRVDAKIDTSTMDINNLTNTRNPLWSEQTLFLKVLLKGRASLFYYNNSNITRFFFCVKDSLIQQLVYKEYHPDNRSLSHLTGETSKINTNNGFRQQLLNDVACENTNSKSLKFIQYQKRDLTKYFKRFNECNGETSTEYKSKIDREIFNIKIAPGVGYARLTIPPSFGYEAFDDFDNSMSKRIGFEAEFILPFNKNKWSIILEPTLQEYSGKSTNNGYFAIIDYSAISASVGVRYYSYLSKKLKVFLNCTANPTIESTGLISFYSAYVPDRPMSSFNIDPYVNLALGGGIEYHNLSAEVRVYSKQNIIEHRSGVEANFRNTSVILGYKILNIRSK